MGPRYYATCNIRHLIGLLDLQRAGNTRLAPHSRSPKYWDHPPTSSWSPPGPTRTSQVTTAATLRPTAHWYCTGKYYVWVQSMLLRQDCTFLECARTNRLILILPGHAQAQARQKAANLVTWRAVAMYLVPLKMVHLDHIIILKYIVPRDHELRNIRFWGLIISKYMVLS